MTKIISAALLALSPLHSFACTVFESPFAGDTGFARNVDWAEKFPDVKGVLVLNPAHAKKKGMVSGLPIKPAEWVSKYRSLTFSIAGAEIPVDGFNEKGLTMAVLELSETAYPKDSDPRAGLGAGQFVQYNLDTSETIEDVIASTKSVRPVSAVKMHYFACDASTKCVVIQYIEGEAKIYRDGELPYSVMTNSPYPQSATAAGTCIANPKDCAKQKDFSLVRFATASMLRGKMKEGTAFSEQAIPILERVAQSTGVVTRFQVVYDPPNRSVKVRKGVSGEFGELKVDFDKADCHQPRKVLPIDETTQDDLAKHWIELTEAYQTDMVGKMGYPGAAAKAYGHYPFTVTCQ